MHRKKGLETIQPIYGMQHSDGMSHDVSHHWRFDQIYQRSGLTLLSILAINRILLQQLAQSLMKLTVETALQKRSTAERAAYIVVTRNLAFQAAPLCFISG